MTILHGAFVDAPADMQQDMYVMIRNLATAHGSAGIQIFVGHGTDMEGHWIGWSPIQ